MDYILHNILYVLLAATESILLGFLCTDHFRLTDVPPLSNFANAPIGAGALRPAVSDFETNPVSSPIENAAHADFGPRFLAAALDFAILALFVGVIVSFYAVATRIPKQFVEQVHPGATPAEMIQLFGTRFLGLLLGVYIVCNWLYFAFSESSVWQATLGKKIVGLCVTDAHRRRLTFARASARFFGGRLPLHIPTIGIPYFLVDCIAAAFPPRHQALHDRMAACLVLKNPRLIEPA
jgi:uncharacterized RDD family membrane protein YckC